jgi:hypothetical protein
MNGNNPVGMNDNDPEFSQDMLQGAKAIAMFMYGRCDQKAQRKIFHLVEKTNFPSFKVGSMICARRSVIIAWVRKMEERSIGEERKQA